jgi:hypothetical protein
LAFRVLAFFDYLLFITLILNIWSAKARAAPVVGACPKEEIFLISNATKAKWKKTWSAAPQTERQTNKGKPVVVCVCERRKRGDQASEGLTLFCLLSIHPSLERSSSSSSSSKS